MKRRSFLRSASLVAAAGSLPLVARAAHAAAAPVFRLWRAESSAPGTPFLPLDAAPACDCGDATLRVWMDAMHLAPSPAPLREFALHALFDVPRARAPYLAWHYAGGAAPSMSRRSSFVAGRATLRGFSLEYRFDGEAACRTQDCALTRLDTALLAPGHYVLAGAGADARALVHGGDVMAPLGAAPGFDYLAFRVEPLA